MGSTSITISDGAYAYLKAMKREGESFSDVILALRSRKEALLKHWGALEDEDLASIDGLRDEFNEEFEGRA